MKLNTSAKGLELTDEFEGYARRRLKGLSRRLPRRERGSATCRVTLSRSARGPVHDTCSIVLAFHNAEFRAKESTPYIYAALDVAVVHIEQQLQAYKRRHRRSWFKAGVWRPEPQTVKSPLANRS